jgi:hypothetical protein
MTQRDSLRSPLRHGVVRVCYGEQVMKTTIIVCDRCGASQTSARTKEPIDPRLTVNRPSLHSIPWTEIEFHVEDYGSSGRHLCPKCARLIRDMIDEDLRQT